MNDLKGPNGTARKVVFPDPMIGASGRRVSPAERTAIIGAWILHLPESHPAWDRYVISVVHLRPLPDVPAPQKHLPAATHELMIVALDPDSEPDPERPFEFKYLRPANLIEQVILGTDERAAQLLDVAAQAVLDGYLPADPEGILGADELWKEVLAATAEHLETGAAPSRRMSLIRERGIGVAGGGNGTGHH